MSFPYMWISFCTLSAYVVLLVLVRWIGSTQLTQVTLFNWVAGASMGNVGANMIAANSFKDWMHACFSLVLFAAATIASALFALKHRKWRAIANGNPTIVIYKGIIQRDMLRKAKVNIDVLFMLLRQQGCFSPKEVEVAILEATGTLSVLPVTDAQTVSKADIRDGPKMSDDTQGPYLEVIMDGEVDYDNLAEAGYDKGWLFKQLADLGVKSPDEVTFLGVNRSGHVIADTHRLEKYPKGESHKDSKRD